MTLEQRLAAIEAELAALKAQKQTFEQVSEAMSKLVRETIKNEQRPGGTLYKSIEKAATDKAAGNFTYRCNRPLDVFDNSGKLGVRIVRI